MERLKGLLDKSVRIYVATAGAGAGLQAKLWAQPGASAYLAEGSFPYSQTALGEFLGYMPDRFVCLETAIDMAISSYLMAVKSCKNGERPIGLGLSAAVSTTRELRGGHRVRAVVISRDQVFAAERVFASEVTFPACRRELEGELTDAVGVELICAAAGLPYTEPYVRDATEEARQHFLTRPVFRRDGRRELAPPGSIGLFPGAFNPLHEGHLATAPEHVLFSITANPPHKPALSLQDMLERSIQFRAVRDVMFTDGDALYLDKARRFPKSSFFIGTDVVERLLDPKWGLEIEPTFREFMDLGIHFYVSPRGQVELQDLLAGVPEEYRPLFTALPRNQYADLSSTQIRARLAAPEPVS